MRKLILLVLSSVMLVSGAYIIVLDVLFAPAIFFRGAIVGAVLASVGAYLIWTDFIAPRLGIKTWED
jgi:hypothetical protein